jgi:hypothetical protein
VLSMMESADVSTSSDPSPLAFVAPLSKSTEVPAEA